MKFSVLLICLICLGLTACGSIRPYDGVYGYQKLDGSEKRVLMAYSDNGNEKWEVVLRRGKEACATELLKSPEKIKILQEERSEFIQNADATVSVPVVVSSVTGEGRQQWANEYNEQYYHRTFSIRRVIMLCE